MENKEIVAGHLKNVQGYYHIVLSYTGYDGKRKTPSFTTGLKVRNNKRNAESLLHFVQSEFIIYDTKEDDVLERNRIKNEIRMKTGQPIIKTVVSKSEALKTPSDSNKRIVFGKDMLFSDYLIYWLENIEKNTIEENTYASYSMNIYHRIAPYFKSKAITLSSLNVIDIQEYYTNSINGFELDGIEYEPVKASTVKRRHANIRKALEYAKNIDLIVKNPADQVQVPRPQKYEGNPYNDDELKALFKAAKGQRIEFAVLLGSFYGLRREEVVGLKWSAIDFDRKTITINHTVTEYTLKGKVVRKEKDRAKNQSSLRTLPLVQPFEQLLNKMMDERNKNMMICGDSYNYDYQDYIYVDELGRLIKPAFVSKNFGLTLKKNNLRKIRFHDLRHSCATLLYRSGVDLKEIQAWLGHSTITTTANIYTHFDYTIKQHSANKLLEAFEK